MNLQQQNQKDKEAPHNTTMTSLEIAMYTAFIALLLYFLLNLNRHPNHPLPPGPKPWPIIGNLPHMGSKPHQSLAALARTYGPLMYLRLGFVDTVVVSSASVASQFLKTHDANFSERPRRIGIKHLAYDHQDLVFGPKWRMLRKLSHVHLFSNKALDHFQFVRQVEVVALTNALERTGEEAPVNLGNLLNVCTTNMVGMMILGKRVFGDGSGSNDEKSDEFKQMVIEVLLLGGMFDIGDFLPALEWLDLQGVAANMKKVHVKFDRLMSNFLEDHRINGGSSGCGGEAGKFTNLLSTLLSLENNNADSEGGKLTDTDIKALLLDMFIAGTDTSSNTVEWAIAELIRHPNILAQLQQEIDLIVGQDRLVTESDIPQLTYLQAIIKETFRLHPPTPLSIPRIAIESCQINGYYIPKGSNILVNVWAISRDPNVWTDPLEFRPNRFLTGGEKPEVDVRGNDFEVIPFGAGRRICVGMSLGLRMVQLLTATLVHAFDWELPVGEMRETLDMEEAYGVTLHRATPLVMHPRTRLSPKIYQTPF